VKLLVLGADSLLGKALVRLLQRQGVAHHGLDKNAFSLLKKMEVVKLFSRHAPTQVIHTAIHTTAEKVESDPDEAERCDIINTRGMSTLAEVCSQLNIPLIHHSGSLVFDGTKTHPYVETDETNPVSRYGKSLWFAERSVRDTLQSHIILRSDWVFSTDNPVFFRRHIEACKQGKGKLEVMNMRFSPTAAPDLARVVLAIANQIDCAAEAWGTYHYCAQQPISQEYFVEHFLQEAANYDPVLEKLLPDLLVTKLPVQLPYIGNTVLGCQLIFETFGIKQRTRSSELLALIQMLYNLQPEEAPELLVEGFDDRENSRVEERKKSRASADNAQEKPKKRVRKPADSRRPARKAAAQKASPRSGSES
jgi:dTDP-4-dehydrorhamnose reductase